MSKHKVYLRDFNGVLKGVRESNEFEWVLDPRDSDCLVLWQDVRGEMLELCKINEQHMKKPVVVVQHGAAATRDYQAPENFKMYATKFCCWGEHDKERLEKAGLGDRAVVTGSPLLNHLKPTELHTDKNIVFCPIVSMHEEPANLITFYELKKIELDFSQRMMKQHKEKLRDTWNAQILNPDSPVNSTIPYYDINKNWRLISKLTPIHDKSLYLGSVTMTSQDNATHIEDCVKLLTQTDVVVGMVEGTFQLLAMAMDIPSVICDEWEFKTYGEGIDYSKSELVQTDASVYSNLRHLRKTIERELANPHRLASERTKVVNRELGDIIQDPVKNIIKTVKELING